MMKSWSLAFRHSSIGLALLLIVGCGPEETAPKTSHFEHDHVVAEHWPSDLADAATKIRDRLDWLEHGRPPESHAAEHEHDEHEHDEHEHDEHEHDEHEHDEHGHDEHRHDEHGHEHVSDPWAEIVEIVSWIPEIAADTNLTEADWLPLYHATESLTANLQSADGKLTNDNRRQLESLCDLVDEAANKIPEQFPEVVDVKS